MYRIKGWMPPLDGQTFGGWSFNIILTPKWKDLVSKSDLNQERIDNIIHNMGKHILRGHGIDIDTDPKYYIRISWGEWGPEHITVPGNSCGLDIDYSAIAYNDGEATLSPHNLDTMTQASIILTLFLKIAELLESEDWLRNNK